MSGWPAPKLAQRTKVLDETYVHIRHRERRVQGVPDEQEQDLYGKLNGLLKRNARLLTKNRMKRGSLRQA